MNKKGLTQKEIEYKIQSYCSYQERCHSEVYKKLKEFKIEEQMINEILSNLITQNFLNESRFSKLFSKSKFNVKNWGVGCRLIVCFEPPFNRITKVL